MTEYTDYADLDNFMNNLDLEISSLSSTDSLLDNLETEMKNSIEQIKNSDAKTKRKLAATINDSYYTKVLAEDENFFVRTLALCNPATSSAVLKKMAESFLKDPFILMVIAHNPNADLETLNKIFTYSGSKADVRSAILANPNCSDTLRYKIEDWTKRRVD